MSLLGFGPFRIVEEISFHFILRYFFSTTGKRQPPDTRGKKPHAGYEIGKGERQSYYQCQEAYSRIYVFQRRRRVYGGFSVARHQERIVQSEKCQNTRRRFETHLTEMTKISRYNDWRK